MCGGGDYDDNDGDGDDDDDDGDVIQVTIRDTVRLRHKMME